MAVIVLVGKGASGKGPIEKELVKKGFNRVKRFTTTPLKEGQLDDPTAYHISDEEFDNKHINEDFAVQVGQLDKRNGIDKKDLMGNSVMIMDTKELAKLNDYKKKNKDAEIYTVYVDNEYNQRYNMLSKSNKSLNEIRRKMLDDMENFATIKMEVDFTVKSTDIAVAVNEILAKVTELHSKIEQQESLQKETGVLKMYRKLQDMLNKKEKVSKDKKEVTTHGV